MQESHQISTENEAKLASEEVALGGVIIGGLLGLLAAAAFLFVYCGLGVLSVVVSSSSVDKDGAVLMVFATTLVILAPVVIICAGLSAIAGGFSAGLGGVLTFAAISYWMRSSFWSIVARAYRRGMLYGSLFGLALQPVLWWVFLGPPGANPIIRSLVKHSFDVGGLIPLGVIFICLQLGGAIAAVRALFELRAGHSPSEWRDLPFPFEEW